MKYRQKSIEVEAIEINLDRMNNSELTQEWPGWLIDAIGDGNVVITENYASVRGFLGFGVLTDGYLVRIPSGIIRPMTRADFESLYEPLNG